MATYGVIKNLFQPTAVTVINAHKQSGVKDCALYTIATTAAIAGGIFPMILQLNQAAM